MTWVGAPDQTTGGTGSAWETVSLVVSDYVTPTATVRIRFSASDNPNNSITEAGIDNVQLEVFVCPDAPLPCPADLTGDALVNVSDLLAVIAAWGPCGKECPADIDDDGAVAVSDLVAVFLAWGACP
jgi:hypothetical protein